MAGRIDDEDVAERMDHDEVLEEQLELAAVEPDGLARLVAGDTPDALAVAGHLPGCDAGRRVPAPRRAAPLLRDVVRTTPPADLRERTLAFVRQHGEPLVSVDAARPPGRLLRRGGGDRVRGPAPGPGQPRSSCRVASIAAAVVLSVVATDLDRRAAQVSQQLAEQDRAIARTEAVTTATIAVPLSPTPNG